MHDFAAGAFGRLTARVQIKSADHELVCQAPKIPMLQSQLQLASPSTTLIHDSRCWGAPTLWAARRQRSLSTVCSTSTTNDSQERNSCQQAQLSRRLMLFSATAGALIAVRKAAAFTEAPQGTAVFKYHSLCNICLEICLFWATSHVQGSSCKGTGLMATLSFSQRAGLLCR